MSNGSLLDDMNDFFNTAGQEVDEARGMTVIRPNYTDTSKNLEIFHSKLHDLGINLDELGNFLDENGDMLVIAGAGSGKTTALILRIIRDLISGDSMKAVTVNSAYGPTTVITPANILVCTFLRSGAEELQASFHEWCRKLDIVGVDHSSIKFSTIHKEVKDTLTSLGVQVNVLEDSHKFVRSAMQKYGIKSGMSLSNKISMEEVNDVASLVAYARNRSGVKRYEHPLMQEYGIDTLLLDALLTDLKTMRTAMGQMDFEDMQEMLLEGLRVNPNVRDVIIKKYDYVYVDEFQDTSELQYEMLKYYFAGSKRIIAIGDDDQTIYSWRGSDSTIIASRFEADHNVVVKALSTNYRCASNILNFVKPSIELNSNRHEKELKSYREGGEVNIVYGGDVNYLVNNLKQDLANGNKVGVLARTNQDLLIPAILLELDGGVEFGLSKSVNLNNRICRQVFGIMDLVTKRFTEEFQSYFRVFLKRYDWHEADKLYNVLVMNRNMNLYNIPIEDLTQSVPKLAPIIKGLREAKSIGGVEAYLFLLSCLEKIAYTGTSAYALKARNLTQFVKKLIIEGKDVKDLSIEQIDELFNSVLPERLGRRIKYAHDIFSKLSTVHEAKGKEWDSVYIWNDTDGTFPSKVGNRDITEEEFEEERRVHYIAVTRAKHKVTIFTEENRESPFLRECDHSYVGQSYLPNKQNDNMQRVHKRVAVEVRPDTDTIVRGYISNLNENGGLTDERVSNMEIVINSYGFEALVEMVDKRYGLSLDPSDSSELLDDFFRNQADEIYNKGLLKP